jgi:hypothetical protein
MQIIRTEERTQKPDEMEILWRGLHGCNLVRLRWARLADWQGWHVWAVRKGMRMKTQLMVTWAYDYGLRRGPSM